MPKVDDSDLQAAWAQHLIDSLAEAGIRDVVISPGSRSTPLVLAAHHHPSLHCHDVIDERSAAFYALGRAKVDGRPPLLLCTSGSAGAHYLPALVEARQAFVPLLVLSADRPLELDQCGANQTIDQPGLYGHQVVAFFDLGVAEASLPALRALRRKAAQAVAASRWPVPGAVHLNARLRKPLEPAGRDLRPARAAARLRARSLARFEVPVRSVPKAHLAALVAALEQTQRRLVICGPAALEQASERSQIEALAAGLGAPLLAEATSQMRFRGNQPGPAVRVDALEVVLEQRRREAAAASGGRAMLPDLILQLGPTPVSGAWLRHLEASAAAGCAHWVVAAHGWPDSLSTATGRIAAAPGELARALAGQRGCSPPVGGAAEAWLAGWSAAEAAAWRRAAKRLAAQRDDPGTPLSEAAAVRASAEAVPAGALLAVGNSLPVRLLDAWVPGSAVAAGVGVWHQRGASGIDGLVSGAAGAAAAARRPLLLLLGDVSLVHDLGGLTLAAKLRSPLAIVVLNNGGGRIFDRLAIADHALAQGALAHWYTPHNTDFRHAAATFGVAFARCRTRPELTGALAAALAHAGATLIEAVVPAHGAAHDLEALERGALEPASQPAPSPQRRRRRRGLDPQSEKR